MRGFALLAFALLSFGPAGAQSLGPIAGKSIVFSIEGDAYPFILYTTPAGRVFLALGFAGEEFKCGWRGSFGLDAQIGRQRPARANARGPGCQFQVEGTTAAQYEGGRLDFTFDGSGQVTGPAGGGFLTKYAGQGAFRSSSPSPPRSAATVAASRSAGRS